MFLSSDISSRLDHSKRFTLYILAPARSIHSNNLTLQEAFSHAAIKTIHSHVSTTVYSQVLIYKLRELGYHGENEIAGDTKWREM